MAKIPVFVDAFNVRKFLGDLPQTPSRNTLISEKDRQELIERVELLDSLLKRALPLIARSQKIINDQAQGIPHLIDGSLEQLRIDIDDAMTVIVYQEEGIPAPPVR